MVSGLPPTERLFYAVSLAVETNLSAIGSPRRMVSLPGISALAK